jgi:hypothetical protein
MILLMIAKGQLLGQGFLDLLWNASSFFIVIWVLFFSAIFGSLIFEK